MSAAPIILDLPFPISVNRIWRWGRRRVFRGNEYLAWIQQAQALCVGLGKLSAQNFVEQQPRFEIRASQRVLNLHYALAKIQPLRL